MGTLIPKTGPGPAELTGEAAAARLEAYERAARTAATGRLGAPARAPALALGTDQLAALFAPRQLEVLVAAPLGRGAPCPDA
jgi:hypothetical protein